MRAVLFWWACASCCTWVLVCFVMLIDGWLGTGILSTCSWLFSWSISSLSTAYQFAMRFYMNESRSTFALLLGMMDIFFTFWPDPLHYLSWLPNCRYWIFLSASFFFSYRFLCRNMLQGPHCPWPVDRMGFLFFLGSLTRYPPLFTWMGCWWLMLMKLWR